MIGDEFLTEERDRKYYADHYTCCPPPLFIILITLVEVSENEVIFLRIMSARCYVADNAYTIPRSPILALERD